MPTPFRVNRPNPGAHPLQRAKSECRVCGFFWLEADVAVYYEDGTCICKPDFSEDEEDNP